MAVSTFPHNDISGEESRCHTCSSCRLIRRSCSVGWKFDSAAASWTTSRISNAWPSCLQSTSPPAKGYIQLQCGSVRERTCSRQRGTSTTPRLSCSVLRSISRSRLESAQRAPTLVVMKLGSCSILDQIHWIHFWALSGGIYIRLTFAYPASVTVMNDAAGGTTNSQNFQLEKIAFSASMKTVDSALQEMYYKQLAEGGVCSFTASNTATTRPTWHQLEQATLRCRSRNQLAASALSSPRCPRISNRSRLQPVHSTATHFWRNQTMQRTSRRSCN